MTWFNQSEKGSGECFFSDPQLRRTTAALGDVLVVVLNSSFWLSRMTLESLKKYFWLWVIVGVVVVSMLIIIIFVLIIKCISRRGKSGSAPPLRGVCLHFLLVLHNLFLVQRQEVLQNYQSCVHQQNNKQTREDMKYY